MTFPLPTCPDGYEFRDCQCLPVVVQSEPVWTDLGVIPQIASSPTVEARIICQIQPFNGKLFLGYGDWNDTKQPGCDLLAYDVVSGATDIYGHYATDAFWSHRVVNGELWAICTDDEIGTNPDFIRVRTDDTVQVVAEALINPWHLFDAVWFNGKPYICGSIAVSSSQDAQGVWSQRDTRTPNRWTIVWKGDRGRAYGLFVMDEAIHVSTSSGKVLRSVDGDTWAQAYSAASLMHKPMNLGDGVVYRSGWPAVSTGNLFSLSKAGGNVIRETNVRDHFVDGTDLWTLGSENAIAWNGIKITDAPPLATSIAVDQGVVYVGTKDSHLHSFGIAA